MPDVPRQSPLIVTLPLIRDSRHFASGGQAPEGGVGDTTRADNRQLSCATKMLLLRCSNAERLSTLKGAPKVFDPYVGLAGRAREKSARMVERPAIISYVRLD